MQTYKNPTFEFLKNKIAEIENVILGRQYESIEKNKILSLLDKYSTHIFICGFHTNYGGLKKKYHYYVFDFSNEDGKIVVLKTKTYKDFFVIMDSTFVKSTKPLIANFTDNDC